MTAKKAAPKAPKLTMKVLLARIEKLEEMPWSAYEDTFVRVEDISALRGELLAES